MTRPPGTGQVAAMAIPKPGSTDLYVLKYRPGEDLGLKADRFEVLPANPAPGNPVQLKVSVMNLGDRPATNVTVAFYLGNPAAGVEIGRTNSGQTLVAGASANLFYNWTVPETAVPLALFAVLDPDSVMADANRLNNVASTEAVQADLAIESLTWMKITENFLSLTARVANQGVITNQPATVQFQQRTNALLKADMVGALAPGESVDVGFFWDVSALNEDAEIWVTVAGTGSEFNPQNNLAKLSVQQVNYRPPLQLGPMLMLPNGMFRFTVTGVPGLSFAIQTSTNLADWIEATNFVLPAATLEVTDSEATNHAHRFYRAVILQNP
ncbi:MAG: hypothetical protein HY674_06475 [Chloroflexi bacterium]|nr:hypothetical protein [Chloroflexota bacterium]